MRYSKLSGGCLYIQLLSRYGEWQKKLDWCILIENICKSSYYKNSPG